MELENYEMLKQTMDNIDMKHHGVLGMRWGVRKNPSSGRPPGEKWKEDNRNLLKGLKAVGNGYKKYEKKMEDLRNKRHSTNKQEDKPENKPITKETPKSERSPINSARDLAKDIPKLNEASLRKELERISLENLVLEQALKSVKWHTEINSITKQTGDFKKVFKNKQQKLLDNALDFALSSAMTLAKKRVGL